MKKLILITLVLILIGAGCARSSENSKNSESSKSSEASVVVEPTPAPQSLPTPPPTPTPAPTPPPQPSKPAPAPPAPASTPAPTLTPTPAPAPKPPTPPPAPAPAPQPPPTPPAPKPPAPPFIISSSAFAPGAAIPVEYSCDGSNINPSLSISGVPEGTKSLALIVDDPDAVQVVGYTWTHWTLWNIAPNTKAIAAGNVPAGASEGLTSFGSAGYGGPCPPSGTHRYYFRLYALNSMLTLKPNASVTTLKPAITKAQIKKTELMGRFTR